jgi:hypothetical protein
VARAVPVALLALLGSLSFVAAGDAESLAIDAEASRVRIHLGRAGLMKFLGHDHEIDAPIAEGRVGIAKAGDPGGSSVRLRFEARRLAVVPGSEPADDVPKVEERMRGPDVLDVGPHPEIAFVSSSVGGEATEPGRYRLRVMGTLEIKGRPCPVEIPLEVRQAGGEIQAHGEGELRLRDLGIEPPSVAGLVRVSNVFKLTIEITARP